MKVIFLDIDGVLNCASTQRRLRGSPFVDEDKLLLLKDLVEKTGAELVLSSTWRLGLLYPDVAAFAADADALVEEFHKYGLSLYDSTPRLSDKQRGHEIAAWLEKNPDVDKFIILDDDSDMAHLKEHLVQTSWLAGLQPSHIEKAMKLLEG